ncbi:MAG TPA: GldG family protein [Candidatus Merdenecus merdavium]|nr:GldG family protein [Candidatus Merdenecus merdavium]
MKEKMKQSFMTKQIKKGSYSIAAIVIVAGILILINLLVGKLPAKFTQIDVTSNKLYTIGDQTKEMLNGLNQDVTLYLITGTGTEDSTITQLLDRYADHSKHIKVEKKDIVDNPGFLKNYTDQELDTNSIVVVGDDRHKVISYYDLYKQEIDYSTYSSKTTGFDGEGQLTSAISYVTSEDLPVIYQLTGHEEMDLPETLKASIEKENIDLETMNLITEEHVPEDAAGIMILAPTTDVSEEEANKIMAYLEGGGKAFIVSSSTSTEEMPHFHDILMAYGVETVDGIVLEGDSDHYYPNYQQYLIPNINTHDVTTQASKTGYVILPLAKGITTLENNRSTLSIESLLSSSDKAYSKTDIESLVTLEKESGDIDGPFDLGVAITEQFEDKETKIVFIACEGILDQTMDQVVSGGNTKLITGALTYLCERPVSISIPEKSLELNYLIVTAGRANTWAFMTTILLPLACMVTGGVVWYRRRRA